MLAKGGQEGGEKVGLFMVHPLLTKVHNALREIISRAWLGLADYLFIVIITS